MFHLLNGLLCSTGRNDCICLQLARGRDRGFVNCTVNDHIFSRFIPCQLLTHSSQVREINIIVDALNGIE